MATKYRKRPVVIEAMQWGGTVADIRAICIWANNTHGNADGDPNVDYVTAHKGGAVTATDVLCHTLEGPLKVSPGDYVIRGVQGELYPCKPDIFEQTYEPVGVEGDHAR